MGRPVEHVVAASAGVGAVSALGLAEAVAPALARVPPDDDLVGAERMAVRARLRSLLDQHGSNTSSTQGTVTPRPEGPRNYRTYLVGSGFIGSFEGSSSEGRASGN